MSVSAPSKGFDGATGVGISEEVFARLADGGVDDVDEGEQKQGDAKKIKHLHNSLQPAQFDFLIGSSQTSQHDMAG